MSAAARSRRDAPSRWTPPPPEIAGLAVPSTDAGGDSTGVVRGRPRPCTGIPAAFRYPLMVSRRIPVAD